MHLNSDELVIYQNDLFPNSMMILFFYKLITYQLRISEET